MLSAEFSLYTWATKIYPPLKSFAFASFVFCLNQSYSPSLDLARGKTQLWVEEEKSEKEKWNIWDKNKQRTNFSLCRVSSAGS